MNQRTRTWTTNPTETQHETITVIRPVRGGNGSLGPPLRCLNWKDGFNQHVVIATIISNLFEPPLERVNCTELYCLVSLFSSFANQQLHCPIPHHSTVAARLLLNQTSSKLEPWNNPAQLSQSNSYRQRTLTLLSIYKYMGNTHREMLAGLLGPQHQCDCQPVTHGGGHVRYEE